MQALKNTNTTNQSNSSNAPDLEYGYMILNHNTDNRWQTKVESVLSQLQDDGTEQFSYLSHECRSEDVNENSFKHEDSEYICFSTWSGNYILGAGSSLRKNPKFEPRKSSNIHFIKCTHRQTKYLGFSDVLDNLHSDCSQGYKPLYLEFNYQHCGSSYKLFTPCRYLNFPNPDLQPLRYLQPICGYVLYEEQGIS